MVAAHNFYLEQAADGGVMLMLAWSIFIGTILFSAVRARALAARVGDQTVRFLAVGVIGGLVGWLVASVFLHLSDFRALLVIAAIAAGADLRVRRTAAFAESATSTVAADRRPPTRVAVWAVAVVGVLSAVGLVAALGTGSTQYRSVTTMAVLPATQKADPSVAYQLDVVSRGLIVPTLAAALDATITPAVLERESGLPADDSLSIDVAQSRLGGALNVTVNSSDEQAAMDAATAAVALAKTQVANLNSRYQVTGEAAVPQPHRPARRWLSLPFALLLAASVVAFWRMSRARAVALEAARSRAPEALAPVG